MISTKNISQKMNLPQSLGKVVFILYLCMNFDVKKS